MSEVNLSTRATAQRLAEVSAASRALGGIFTIPCKHCGAPLWAIKSVTAQAGPICRSRHKKNSGPVGDPTTNPTDKTAA